ncbi:hypothetical protein [Streptodolium elevatio]|uniref:Uncharacterized protein n=1 Tax=Streptodolium elevatio TaxID=3157996 RepID=A0ABV3DLM2_9ACTN
MDTIATTICGHNDCTRRVDQAEHQLCGTTPGRPGGIGCGHWYCDRHLHTDVSTVAYTCDTCRDQALRLPKAAAGLAESHPAALAAGLAHLAEHTETR